MGKDNFDNWSLSSLERELERVRDRISHLDENYYKEDAKRIGAKLSQREDEILAAIEKLEGQEPSLQEQVEALSQYMKETQKRILSLEAKVQWQEKVIAAVLSKLIHAQFVRPAMELEQWDSLYRSKPD